MDLHLNHGEPAPEERQAVDSVLGEPESGWRGGPRSADRDGHAALGNHGAGAQRHLLLPVLHAIQARMGWITPAALAGANTLSPRRSPAIDIKAAGARSHIPRQELRYQIALPPGEADP
ncbi:MAG TPA: hypothetical protein VL523_04825, partial [Terriglobia bacterium]|nr:hypothetical protein [Terriglobia bacterium]